MPQTLMPALTHMSTTLVEAAAGRCFFSRPNLVAFGICPYVYMSPKH